MSVYRFIDRDTEKEVELSAEEVIEDLQTDGEDLISLVIELLSTLDDWQLSQIKDKLEVI